MQKTVEMIEEVIKHLNNITSDPSRSPEARQSAEDLLKYLKLDLERAKRAAAAAEK